MRTFQTKVKPTTILLHYFKRKETLNSFCARFCALEYPHEPLCCTFFRSVCSNRPVRAVVKDIVIDVVSLEFDSRTVKSNTVSPATCHRCDFSVSPRC